MRWRSSGMDAGKRGHTNSTTTTSSLLPSLSYTMASNQATQLASWALTALNGTSWQPLWQPGGLLQAALAHCPYCFKVHCRHWRYLRRWLCHWHLYVPCCFLCYRFSGYDWPDLHSVTLCILVILTYLLPLQTRPTVLSLCNTWLRTRAAPCWWPRTISSWRRSPRWDLSRLSWIVMIYHSLSWLAIARSPRSPSLQVQGELPDLKVIVLYGEKVTDEDKKNSIPIVDWEEFMRAGRGEGSGVERG